MDTFFPSTTLFRSHGDIDSGTDGPRHGARESRPGRRHDAFAPRGHDGAGRVTRLRAHGDRVGCGRRSSKAAGDGGHRGAHLGDPADVVPAADALRALRSEEHTSELQSLMRISYAVFCLKNKKHITHLSFHTSVLSTLPHY